MCRNLPQIVDLIKISHADGRFPQGAGVASRAFLWGLWQWAREPWKSMKRCCHMTISPFFPNPEKTCIALTQSQVRWKRSRGRILQSWINYESTDRGTLVRDSVAYRIPVKNGQRPEAVVLMARLSSTAFNFALLNKLGLSDSSKMFWCLSCFTCPLFRAGPKAAELQDKAIAATDKKCAGSGLGKYPLTIFKTKKNRKIRNETLSNLFHGPRGSE